MRTALIAIAIALTSCAKFSQLDPAAPVGARLAVERIFDTFNACDVEGLVANYSDDNLVFFTPGTPNALRSRSEVRKYFSYLESEPCSSPGSAKHTNVALEVRPLGAGAAIVHAITVVKYENAGKAVSFPFYFTLLLQEHGGRWTVVSQTAQPVPNRHQQ